MKKNKAILYAGDSPVGGPANYLLAILKTLPVKVTHIPPGVRLKKKILEDMRHTAYIFSDFSYRDLPFDSEKTVIDHMKRGSGFLMIGGWGSFAGPFGGWQKSKIADLLPVECLARDDRRNVCTGLVIERNAPHGMLRGISFKDAPIICGLNEVIAKKKARVILKARKINNRPGGVALDSRAYPLLILSGNPDQRTAAFTTDLAPHWCGGLVDWGRRRRRLKVTGRIAVEVGEGYIVFVRRLLSWLTRL